MDICRLYPRQKKKNRVQQYKNKTTDYNNYNWYHLKNKKYKFT